MPRLILFLCVLCMLAAAPAVLAQAGPQPMPLPHPELPKPSKPSKPVSLWTILGIAAISLALLGAVFWMLFCKMNARAVSQPPPLSVAHRRLLDLLQTHQTSPPEEVAHRVSVIMRDYQLARDQVPAPFRTREELYDMQEFTTAEDRRERFARVALTSDEIAFSPRTVAHVDAESLIKSAIETLRHEDSQNSGPPPLTVT